MLHAVLTLSRKSLVKYANGGASTQGVCEVCGVSNLPRPSDFAILLPKAHQVIRDTKRKHGALQAIIAQLAMPKAAAATLAVWEAIITPCVVRGASSKPSATGSTYQYCRLLRCSGYPKLMASTNETHTRQITRRAAPALLHRSNGFLGQGTPPRCRERNGLKVMTTISDELTNNSSM